MLSCKHAKFTLPSKVTYLNCAYMAPLLTSVEKAGIRGIRLKRNPAAVSPQMFFDDTELLRSSFSKLVNADDPQRIVVIPSVSYGMATVAANMNVKRGQHILVAAEQFPSNYYCWKRLCEKSGAEIKVIGPPDTYTNRGKRWNERILEEINEQTAAVAIAHFHWADGTRFDLEAIRAKTRAVNALLIVDGTQSVGAFPFDIKVIQPDALICAGYKWLLGPYSIGLAYYGPVFDNGNPLEENWINRQNSEDFTGLVSYRDAYQPGALCYEVGEHSNFILIPMMLKAIDQLNRWKPEFVQEYCRSITSTAITQLRENGYWVEDDDWRGSHLFGVRSIVPRDVNAIREKLLRKNIFVSMRGDAIRVSPNVYNREQDLQKLVNVLISKS